MVRMMTVALVLVSLLSSCAILSGTRNAGRVVDTGWVLAPCRSTLVDAADRLARTTGGRVHIELMPDAGDLALDVVADSRWSDLGLDDHDLLVLGTVAGPHAQLLQGMALDAHVSQEELDSAMLDRLRPLAQAGDWCGGLLALIAAYEVALLEDPTSSPTVS